MLVIEDKNKYFMFHYVNLLFLDPCLKGKLAT